MSSGMECNFFEAEPGKWFYILQNWDCPAGAWDWREYASCCGGFPSEEAAREHLRENHSNPGGSSTYGYDELRSDGTLKEFQRYAAEAVKP